MRWSKERQIIIIRAAAESIEQKKKKKTLGYQGIRQEMVSDTSHELCIIPGIYIRMYACITNKLVRILDKPQNNTHRAAVK